MNPARYMCTSSCQRLSLNSAASSFDVDHLAVRIEKPVGWFIQPFTEITMSEPVMPATIIGTPASMCTRPTGDPSRTRRSR